MNEAYDVIVVGSGAAGAMAALRARERGLSVLVVEKSSKFGGTSATSGGVIWIPNNGLGEGDSRAEALRYLDAVTEGPVQRDRLEAYVDRGPEMLDFMRSLGIEFTMIPWPDYMPKAPGARIDRSIIFPKYDGRRLGERFMLMREQFARYKLLNRYSMDFAEAFSISTRAKGWLFTLAKVVGRYWLDFGVRKRTRRDRVFTLGCAMMGPLWERLFQKGVELRLDTRLDKILFEDGRVSGVEVSRFGAPAKIAARYGVVVGAGGFEWNQALRDRYFTLPGLAQWSSTPQDANRGEVLEAALAIGADTEFVESGWWIPTMVMPILGASNFEQVHQAVIDVGRPHSVCVNRNGVRFVDEACGYDSFGKAMVADQLATGANTPCWLVFDAVFRKKFTAGGFMPTAIMPDRKIPPDWWDHYIFKADSIASLAGKIGVPPDVLTKTVAAMNDHAGRGEDPEFGRGGDAYDLYFGDATVKPNPCLGPIAKAPFYAIPVNLGDLGTKGGLKCDSNARVLDTSGAVISGLYAAGNASGSPFGNCYPGAGGTIGPAAVFGYIAGDDIANRAGNKMDG
jgi:3-oxosteroid 1-dehydrogenase